jgi:benzoylformate decarboxylase
MTGKRALVEMLVAEGLEYVFGNPGTSETPLMDALQDYPKLKFMLSLQENSAVAMADAYARATRKPAFVNLHIAGGLAGGISMLYDSYKGGTPMVLTAGNSDTRMFLSDPVLSGDLVEMTRQYTKWSVQINHAFEVPVAVRRAFREASTPPTGPVFISFPWDSLDDEADIDIVPSSPVYQRLRPDKDALAKAVALLAQADSPTMLVGDRVSQSEAVNEAVEVAEHLGAKVFASAYTEVNFSTSHPQFMGVLNLNDPATTDRLAGADVVLAVGTNVFSSFLYVSDPFLATNTKLIHLDSSSMEVEKVYPTEVGMVADPKASLSEMADALQQEMSGSAKEAARTRAASIANEKTRAKEAYQKLVKERWDHNPMSVERMMTELGRALPSDAIIADESITSRGALFGAMDFDEPGSLYGEQGGALGWGMPGPLGLKLANPDRPVVAVVGDGSSLYTIQALWTAARYNIPVTWVICNNRTYRILKLNMEIYLRKMLNDTERKSQFLGMDFPLPLNLAGIAEGFDVHGRKVEDPSKLGPALEEALGLGKPAVVDVVIDGSL